MISLVDSYNKVKKLLVENKGIIIQNRVLITEAIKKLDEDLESGRIPFYIIRAPTGYGKTSFTYTLFQHIQDDSTYFNKVIHVLPLRSIIEDAYKTAVKIFGDKCIKMQMMDAPGDPLLLGPLTFTTVDTFVYDAMKLNTARLSSVRKGSTHGYDYFSQASIFLGAIVLDEAHRILEDNLLSNAFLTLLKILLRFGVPIFILTATISKGYVKGLKREVIHYDDYSFKVFPNFGEDPVDDFFERERSKKFHVTLIPQDGVRINRLINNHKRNLIIVNTVARAQKIYNMVKDEKNFKNVLLLHSRFKKSDRDRLMTEIERYKNEDEWIIVSTQVIEAGVDISSDILITDIAPPTSMIQRMGRVARFNENEADIYILGSIENSGPYSKEVCIETRKLLEMALLNTDTSFNPRILSSYQWLLDEIYRILPDLDRSYYRLMTLVVDPLSRARDVLNKINELVREKGAFLRRYPVNLRIFDEPVPVSEPILRRILKKWKSPIKIEKTLKDKKVVERLEYDNRLLTKIIRDIIIQGNIELVLDEEIADKIYSKELGLIV